MPLILPKQIYKSKAFDRYENMEFEPYEYNEYPMAVTIGVDEVTGQPIQQIAQNDAERDALLAGKEVIPERDIRETLITAAKHRGVQIDKRWTTDRIQRALDDAART